MAWIQCRKPRGHPLFSIPCKTFECLKTCNRILAEKHHLMLLPEIIEYWMAKKGRGLVYIIMAIERRKGKERKENVHGLAIKGKATQAGGVLARNWLWNHRYVIYFVCLWAPKQRERWRESHWILLLITLILNQQRLRLSIILNCPWSDYKDSVLLKTNFKKLATYFIVQNDYSPNLSSCEMEILYGQEIGSSR